MKTGVFLTADNVGGIKTFDDFKSRCHCHSCKLQISKQIISGLCLFFVKMSKKTEQQEQIWRIYIRI